MNQFNTLFEPQSIAVIGASTQVGSVGNDVVKNLIEQSYPGNLYLINPKEGEIYGKKLIVDIDNVQGSIDLAIIIVPAKVVPNVLEQCGKKRIQSVIIISAGFREAGKLGLEEEIKRIANQYSISLLGPNCLGIINPHQKLNASFAPLMPKEGNIAFLSQSGALCASILDWAHDEGIGFSKFVSTGNKALIDEYALIQYFLEDEMTQVIALYVEDLRHTQELIELLQGAQTKKPVIVLKSGRTKEGISASASHTGALAGSDASYDALFRQAGILRVENTKELFLAMKSFSCVKELPQGKGMVVITNAGGPGVLMTDALSERKLHLAVFSGQTNHQLKESLPLAASIKNPIDVLGDAHADRYAFALKTALEDSSVHSVCLILTPQTMTEVLATAQSIVEIGKSSKKPIISVFMGEALVHEGLQYLKENNILTAQHPHEGAFIAELLYKWYEILHREYKEGEEEKFSLEEKEKGEYVFRRARSKKVTGLPEAYALPFFEAFGFRTLTSNLAENAKEAQEYTHEIGGDVVLKIVSPDILHKSDVGGIQVGVSLEEVPQAYENMLDTVRGNVPDARIDGIMVVEMAPNRGASMVVGAHRDRSLGPVMMVGLGGIYVEILKDVSFGVLPLKKEDVKVMIESLQTFPLLDGARGGEKMDQEALVEAVMKIASIMRDFPEIEEMDINPLLVLPRGEGVIVMDSRISLKEKTS